MKTFDKHLLQRFAELISKKTGLRIRSQDIETLRKIIFARTKFHVLSSPEAYYQLLDADTEKSRLEQQELISLLTVGETYFSRDEGQFELLKNTILPALIAETQDNNEEAKTLFKKSLYLAPTFIAAYLELGALYEREHDDMRARKMRTTAMELLTALTPDKAVEPYNEVTAGELLCYIKKMLDFTKEK